MTNRPALLVSWALLLVLTGSAVAAGDESLRDAIDRFVALDCSTGEALPAGRELRSHGDGAIPLLRQLLDQGPDPAEIETMRFAIEAAWEARREFLDSSTPTGLSIESLQSVRLRDHDAYVERRLATFESRVRERAALALHAIGSSAARRALVESPAAQEEGALSELIERLMRSPKSGPERAARSSPAR